MQTAKMRKLIGRFDSMAADVEETVSAKQEGDSEYATYLEDTFRISVKDPESEKVLYENKNEPYRYPRVDSIQNALRFKGAVLSDDQITFIGEALTGDETGKAVLSLLEDLNGLLKDRAKKNQYSSVLQDKLPATESDINNSRARMVRDFIRQNPSLSPATVIDTLKQFNPSFKDYTVAMFEANKGKI